MAATETKSLSLSRGVRFIDSLDASNVPNPWQVRRQSQRCASEMASEVGICAAQQESICGEPTGDNKPGDRGHAGAQYTPSACSLGCTRPFEKPARVLARRRQDHCRECRRTIETGRIIDDARNVAFAVQRVSANKFAP